MTILRRAEDVVVERDCEEVCDVVDDDEVGIEVDDSVDGEREEIGEVDAGVVERLVKGAANRGGDLVADEVGVEVVEREREGRESGGDGVAEVGVVVGEGEEVECDVFRAGGVAEDREYGGD